MSVLPLGGRGSRATWSVAGGRLVMVPPGQVPNGAQVIAVVALVPGVAPAACLVGGRSTATTAVLPDRSAKVVPPAEHRQIGPDLRLDLDGRTVHAGGQPLALTRREFDLLAHLSARPGRVLTRAQLLAAVWGPADPRYTGPRTVDVHVARLRRKLKRHAAPLTTLRGVGYRWSTEPKVTR